MSQSGFTPIQLYRTATASAAPSAANLIAGELAINYTDGRLFYEDNLGAVQVIASKNAAAGTFVNLSYTGTLTGGTGTIDIGSGQFVKDSSGNITLGGESFVQNSGGVAAIARFGSTIASGRAVTIGLGNNAGAVRGTISLDAGTEMMTIGSEGNFPLVLQTVGIARLSIDGSGNSIFSGVVGLPDGSAAAPSLVRSASPTTGWYFSSSSSTGFSSLGDNVVTIGQNGGAGFLGIGSTVIGGIGTGFGTLKTNGVNGSGIKMYDDEVDSAVVYTTGSDLYVQNQTASGALILGTGSGAEGARLTPARYFKASNDGTYISSTGDYHEFVQDQSAPNLLLTSRVLDSGSTYGLYHQFDGNATDGYHFAAVNNATAVCFVLANGNVQNANNSYGAISDLKYKTEVADAPSYLERFMKVKFRTFRFKEETGFETMKQFGVIAQELEEIFPGLVDSAPDFKPVKKIRVVDIPAIAEVLDDKGNVITAAKEATTVEEEYTESIPLDTFSKSVKYSVLSQMQGKVIQELCELINRQQFQIENVLRRISDLETSAS